MAVRWNECSIKLYASESKRSKNMEDCDRYWPIQDLRSHVHSEQRLATRKLYFVLPGVNDNGLHEQTQAGGHGQRPDANKGLSSS